MSSIRNRVLCRASMKRYGSATSLRLVPRPILFCQRHIHTITEKRDVQVHKLHVKRPINCRNNNISHRQTPFRQSPPPSSVSSFHSAPSHPIPYRTLPRGYKNDRIRNPNLESRISNPTPSSRRSLCITDTNILSTGEGIKWCLPKEKEKSPSRIYIQESALRLLNV